MIIDCISDLHGHYLELEGGDLLIVAGDLTGRDTLDEYYWFDEWLRDQDYRMKIVIAGNHDGELQKVNRYRFTIADCYGSKFQYLCDSETEFEGLKIWGSPWTKTFEGMNPHCKAFTCDTEEELAEKWELIPDDIDILVTHSPPHGIFDKTIDEIHVGSYKLREHSMRRIRAKIHVFGHIHECGGNILDTNVTKFINCSHVNENYQPVNKPIRVIL